MNCSNCGSYVAPSVRFCSNCGAPAADPEVTRIARIQSGAMAHPNDSDDVENTVFTVRPTLIFIKAGYVAAVLGAVGLTILLAMISWPRAIPFYISVPVAMALLLIPAYYHLRRNTVRYTVTDAKLEIDTGLVARTTRNIPLSKVQDVTVSAGIAQRILGFGDIVVDNAVKLAAPS